MTIDEAIENEKELSEHCKRMFEEMSAEDKLANKLLKSEIQYHEQFAEWLEELKAFRENKWTDIYIKRGYDKAIEDFAEKLKSECREHYIDCDPYFGGITDSILYEDDIEEVVEQLKEVVRE